LQTSGKSAAPARAGDANRLTGADRAGVTCERNAGKGKNRGGGAMAAKKATKKLKKGKKIQATKTLTITKVLDKTSPL
jgi:hypothetical protein